MKYQATSYVSYLSKCKSNLRWKLALAIMLPISFLMSLDRVAMSVAAPLIQQEFKFSLNEMALILTAFHWAYGGFTLIAGFLAAKFGARKSLFVASALWSLFTGLIPFAGSANLFVTLRVLLGCGQAIDQPSLINAVRNWFPLSERSKGNAVLLAGIYLGPILGLPFSAYAIFEYGWRSVFYIFGGVGLIVAVIWWKNFRDTPAIHPHITPDELRYIGNDEVEIKETKLPLKGLLKAFIRKTDFWIVGILSACVGCIFGFYNTWLPSYLENARHISLGRVGFYAALPWIGLVISIVFGGILADALQKRIGSVRKIYVTLAAIGFLISSVGLQLLGRYAETNFSVVTFLVLILLAMGLVQIAIWSAVQDIGGQYTSVVAGWANALMNVGAAIGPLLMAYSVSVHKTWNASLTAIGYMGALGFFLSAFMFFNHRELLCKKVSI